MSSESPTLPIPESPTPSSGLGGWLSGPIYRRAAVILIFLVVYFALQIGSYREKSATFDEPLHLTAGYLAAQRGDYRLDVTHPPLVRLWAALPLLAMDGLKVESTEIDRTPPRRWSGQSFRFAHDFLYEGHDADRLLYAARLMIVVLGAALGLLLCAWAWEWLGPVPAVGILGFYLIEPNLSAHAALVTTDVGPTLFFTGTVYFLWRTIRCYSWANVAAVALCFGAALISKFSAVLLVPLVAVILVVAVWRRNAQFTLGRALALMALLGATSYVMIWAVYGFRYAPSPSPEWIYRSEEMVRVDRYLPVVGPMLNWIDAHRLLPNAFTQGFVLSFATSAPMAGYLDGEISASGWWYYFPVAILIKTPLGLLVLGAIGIVSALVCPSRFSRFTLFVLTFPAATYLAVAMTSDINIGLRHVLPVYPVFLLLAVVGATVIAAWPRRVKWIALVLPVGGWIAAFAHVYPHTLTFFNPIVGGPARGWNYLVDSNLDWGQHLKLLKRWMDEQNVTHVNFAYFGMADPGYYGIDYTYLPGSPLSRPQSPAPRLPGYVAISATTLSGTHLRPEWRTYYEGFRALAPVEVIGNTIFIFKIDAWPVPHRPASPPPTREEIAALRAVADALFTRKKWPAQAAPYYAEYLAHAPDLQVSFNYAVCLLETGQVDAALNRFATLAASAPKHATLHRRIAGQLLNHREFAVAVEYAEKAAALAPASVRARILLEMAQAALAHPSAAPSTPAPDADEDDEAFTGSNAVSEGRFTRGSP